MLKLLKLISEQFISNYRLICIMLSSAMLAAEDPMVKVLIDIVTVNFLINHSYHLSLLKDANSYRNQVSSFSYFCNDLLKFSIFIRF